MRFLESGTAVSSRTFTFRLAAEGHEVRVSISEPMPRHIGGSRLPGRTTGMPISLGFWRPVVTALFYSRTLPTNTVANRMSCAARGFQVIGAARSATGLRTIVVCAVRAQRYRPAGCANVRVRHAGRSHRIRGSASGPLCTQVQRRRVWRVRQLRGDGCATVATSLRFSQRNSGRARPSG